jgi:putative spermidine/putrescine transport system permease protein
MAVAEADAGSADGAGGTRASRFRLRPRPLWLVVPGILFLTAFLLYPALQLLSLGFDDASSGAWSLAAFRRIFGVSVYLRVLSNTFAIAAETTVLSLLLGYPLAYWLNTLAGRRRRLVTLLVLLPFWTGALVKNFAWLVLLGRNGIAATVMAWLGLPPTDLLFGRTTVLFGMTHTMLPMAVVAMLPVMSRIDWRLIAAAGTLGASRAEAFWRVFFHLSMPGVAAAGLLVFIGSLGFFITPSLLGGPQDTMLGQVVIIQINQMQNWPFGSALAGLLVVSALVACFAFDRIFGLSAVTGSGKPARHRRGILRRTGLALLGALATGSRLVATAIGKVSGGHRFRWLLPLYAWTVVVVLVLPIAALVPMALTSGKFLSFPPPGFGLAWVRDYFASPVWMAATLRSFIVGLVTALATLLITVPAALGLARTTSPFKTAVFLLFLAPMVVPSIVVAIALFYLFAHMSLVATDLGIVIGHTVMAIPVAFVIMVTVLKSYDWQLDLAAGTLGANRFQVFTRVTAPLLKGALFAAFIFAFLNSFEELTIAMFVGGGLKSTLPKQMWDDVTLQVSPTLAAASAFVVLVVFALFILAELVRPRPVARAAD